ncbi:MAG: WYL domain-containing protein [Phormidesmis sp. RL_2_1]|nr:WYL domain-containing protein [Phormidesmis sp. RL_2_1]
MGRKGRSVTLSLSDKDKERLEAIALHYDMTWGDRANISKLIEAIARQKLKLAPNHDWKPERIALLETARKLLIDAGKLEYARTLAKWMCDRSELTIPQRQELERFLQRDICPWRIQVERYIDRQQPFRLTYQDAADRPWQFTVYHARIVPRKDREYLDCWCEETDSSQDLPQLAHNRTLRLDRITDAAVSKVGGRWRLDLATLEVTLHLYGGLAIAYRTKQGRDVSVNWLDDQPQTLCVVRQMTSFFWFMRDILPYGADCEVIGPPPVREKVREGAIALVQRYQT